MCPAGGWDGLLPDAICSLRSPNMQLPNNVQRKMTSFYFAHNCVQKQQRACTRLLLQDHAREEIIMTFTTTLPHMHTLAIHPHPHPPRGYDDGAVASPGVR